MLGLYAAGCIRSGHISYCAPWYDVKLTTLRSAAMARKCGPTESHQRRIAPAYRLDFSGSSIGRQQISEGYSGFQRLMPAA